MSIATKARLEAALRSAMNTPHKPLKEKPKAARKPKKKPPVRLPH
jgi:hypothetical protein